MTDENLKIREDAIKIQERDIEDSTKGLELENTKVSVVLGFEGLLLVEALSLLGGKPALIKILFVLPLFASMVVGFYNLFAKKIKSHTNVEEIFVRKNSYQSWSDYIDVKHLRLNGVYEETRGLLRQKSHLTNWSFVLLLLAVVVLIVISMGGAN